MEHRGQVSRLTYAARTYAGVAQVFLFLAEEVDLFAAEKSFLPPSESRRLREDEEEVGSLIGAERERRYRSSRIVGVVRYR